MSEKGKSKAKSGKKRKAEAEPDQAEETKQVPAVEAPPPPKKVYTLSLVARGKDSSSDSKPLWSASNLTVEGKSHQLTATTNKDSTPPTLLALGQDYTVHVSDKDGKTCGEFTFQVPLRFSQQQGKDKQIGGKTVVDDTKNCKYLVTLRATKDEKQAVFSSATLGIPVKRTKAAAAANKKAKKGA